MEGGVWIGGWGRVGVGGEWVFGFTFFEVCFISIYKKSNPLHTAYTVSGTEGGLFNSLLSGLRRGMSGTSKPFLVLAGPLGLVLLIDVFVSARY